MMEVEEVEEEVVEEEEEERGLRHPHSPTPPQRRECLPPLPQNLSLPQSPLWH